MKREIKFRARRIDTEAWVYGHYFQSPLTDENSGAPSSDGWFFLSGETRHCIEQNHLNLVIDENTLGQYTGLKDKNGKEIYEGDVVKHTFQQTVPVNGSFNAPVFFHQGGFVIGTVNDEPLTLREAIKISNKADGLEIIGNIYENPELLNT